MVLLSLNRVIAIKYNCLLLLLLLSHVQKAECSFQRRLQYCHHFNFFVFLQSILIYLVRNQVLLGTDGQYPEMQVHISYNALRVCLLEAYLGSTCIYRAVKIIRMSSLSVTVNLYFPSNIYEQRNCFDFLMTAQLVVSDIPWCSNRYL